MAATYVTTTLNGPSCSGSIMGPDVVTREVKVGDIIIIPAGVPHGWATIPDHVSATRKPERGIKNELNWRRCRISRGCPATSQTRSKSS